MLESLSVYVASYSWKGSIFCCSIKCKAVTDGGRGDWRRVTQLHSGFISGYAGFHSESLAVMLDFTQESSVIMLDFEDEEQPLCSTPLKEQDRSHSMQSLCLLQ